MTLSSPILLLSLPSPSPSPSPSSHTHSLSLSLTHMHRRLSLLSRLISPILLSLPSPSSHTLSLSLQLTRTDASQSLSFSFSHSLPKFEENKLQLTTPTSNFSSNKTLRLLLKTGFRLTPIMKYLEYTPVLNGISNFLNHLTLGIRKIDVCLEAYSCKHTRAEKKLSLILENEIVDHLGKSLDAASMSSVEYLFRRSSRKTLIYLVLTLHQIYPGFSISAIEANDFFAEESWDSFSHVFDIYMSEASKAWLQEHDEGTLLETLRKALDEVVKLSDCEIYSYNPKAEADPFLESLGKRGAIWSFHCFFYNRKQKCVVSFRFSCLSNLRRR